MYTFCCGRMYRFYNINLYVYKNQKIIFMRHSILKFLALFSIAFCSAQNLDIRGTVLDEGGIPIPGANILVKNTSKGAVTDFDGNFTIND